MLCLALKRAITSVVKGLFCMDATVLLPMRGSQAFCAISGLRVDCAVLRMAEDRLTLIG